MGHRHLFGTSQMCEDEQDQNWNHMHVEQPFPNSARIGPAENGPPVYPVEALSVDRHFPPHWNPGSSSNAYPFPSHGVELSCFQPATSGPSHDTFPRPSVSATFGAAPENMSHHASSSGYHRQPYHGLDSGFIDHAVVHGRGPHKRKSPGILSGCDRGSTSRYYGGSSSSNHPPSYELQQEKAFLDPQYAPWERSTLPPSYPDDLSLAGEGSSRNVRSRPALDLEPNPARTQLSINPSQSSYSSSYPLDQFTTVDFSGPSTCSLTHDRNHARIPPVHGKIPVSDANDTNPFTSRIPFPDASETNLLQSRIHVSDPNGFSRETNHFLIGNGISDAPMDVRAYYPQNVHGASSHSSRGVRSGYSHRSSQAFRASSSSVRLGHRTPSDDGFQLFDESYSSRQPRPQPSMHCGNTDRNRRSRIPYERYRSPSNEASLHDRFTSEGFMVVDRSAFYGPRSMFDPHRDMRLDIDTMSYEELLALGERIGSVNTGLAEDLISKCLNEIAKNSSGPIHKEGNCVICLEEYTEQDDIGALKTCGHDYHVSCIRKWLSMKNSCPICKASALADYNTVE